MVTARSFRPPASGIFGQADRAASLQLASAGMALLQQLSDEEIAVEDSRQVSNAMAALETERGKLNAYMDENPDSADQWGQWFAGEQDSIRQRVMAGITQPGARERVSGALTETFAGWSNTVADRRRGQIWKNSNTDFGTRQKARATQSRSFKSEDDMIAYFAEGLTDIQDAATHDPETGRPPLISEDEAVELRRELAHQAIGDYLAQISVGIEDKKLRNATIERANELAADFGLPEQTFGPDDLRALKTKVEQIRKAARQTADDEREAMLDKFSTELANTVSQGDYVKATKDVYARSDLLLDEQSSFLDYILKAQDRPRLSLTPEKKRYREDLMSRARRATTTEQQNALDAEVISATTGTDPQLDYDDGEAIRDIARKTFADAQESAVGRAVSNTDVLVKPAEDALEALKNLQLLTADKISKEEGEALVARIAEANDRLIAQKGLQDRVIQEIHGYAADEGNWKNDASRIWIDTQQMIRQASRIADQPLELMEAMLQAETLGLTIREIEMAHRRSQTTGQSFESAIKRAQEMNAPAERQTKAAEARVITGAFQSISTTNSAPKVMIVRGRPELTEVYMADGTVMRPGDIYEQGGNKYRFKGLDDNNELDFEEIK